MKIGVYSICKNESSRIEDWVKNLKEFDQVVVLDTGSTDDSVEKLKRLGIKVAEKLFDPFSFCDARNHALSLFDDDIDWCLWLDFNEELEGFSKERFFSEINDQITAVRLHRHNRENGVVYPGTESHPKVHRKDFYTWQYRIHEQLKIKEGYHLEEIYSKIKVIKNVSWSNSKMMFYQELCEIAVSNNEENIPHYLWFLTEYYEKQSEWVKLRNACIMYLENTEGYKINFRIFIWRRLARATLKLDDVKSAIMYATSSITECLFFKDELYGSIDFLRRSGIENNSKEFLDLHRFFSVLYLENK